MRERFALKLVVLLTALMTVDWASGTRSDTESVVSRMHIFIDDDVNKHDAFLERFQFNGHAPNACLRGYGIVSLNRCKCTKSSYFGPHCEKLCYFGSLNDAGECDCIENYYFDPTKLRCVHTISGPKDEIRLATDAWVYEYVAAHSDEAFRTTAHGVAGSANDEDESRTEGVNHWDNRNDGGYDSYGHDTYDFDRHPNFITSFAYRLLTMAFLIPLLLLMMYYVRKRRIARMQRALRLYLEENAALTRSAAQRRQLAELLYAVNGGSATAASRLTRVVIYMDRQRQQVHTLTDEQVGAIAHRVIAQNGECGQCSICLADFVANERAKELPCAHIFHAGCIDEWLTEHDVTCPMCRADVDAALSKMSNDVEPAQRVDAAEQISPEMLNVEIGTSTSNLSDHGTRVGATGSSSVAVGTSPEMSPSKTKPPPQQL